MSEMTEGELVVRIIKWVGLVVVLATALGMWGCPRYTVYARRLDGEAELANRRLVGEAELAQAQYSRQVQIADANGKLEAAKLLVARDSLQAMGAAAANRILGESLKNNEAYLRYLWIQNLAQTGKEVVYVPTEANLPILEAGKR